MLSTQEAAERIKASGQEITADRVALLARNGAFPNANKDNGGKWRIAPEDVDNYLKQEKRRKSLRRWFGIGSILTLVTLLTIISVLKDGLDLVRDYILPAAGGQSSEVKGGGGLSPQSQTVADGIYISRIINPPYDESEPSKSSVWLIAHGPSTYTVDSIEIYHQPGHSMSMGSGAFPPDASYQFTFSYGSRETQQLNPYLRLSPDDKREVSFTLGLAPEGRFPSVGGYVTARIYYHTAEGDKGSLLLEEPSEEGIFFSRLLSKNVAVPRRAWEWQIIAPNGLQIGSQKNLESIKYIPLRFPSYYSYDLTSEEKTPQVANLNERELLNKAVSDAGKIPDVLSNRSNGGKVFFDFCAGLLNKECEQALLDASSADEFFPQSAYALSIRHMIQPNDTLSNHILSNMSRIKSLLVCTEKEVEHRFFVMNCENADIRRNLIAALKFHREGKWGEALLKLAEFDHDACEALEPLKNELRGDQLERVYQICNARN